MFLKSCNYFADTEQKIIIQLECFMNLKIMMNILGLQQFADNEQSIIQGSIVGALLILLCTFAHFLPQSIFVRNCWSLRNQG